jgi:hypothetical protein
MLGPRPTSVLLTSARISLATFPLLGTLLLGTLLACDRPEGSASSDSGAAKQAEPAQPETKRAAEPPAAALVAPEPPEPVSSTPAPPPAEPTPGPGTLEFGAAKIMPTDKPELAITLDHEGKVGLGGTPGAMTISADGKVTGADGKPIAKVDDGGVLTMAGRSTGIVLTANGLALSTPDGRKVTMVFHPETGEVVMDPPAGPGMKMVSKGCSAPVTKTCALVLSLYLLAADNQK